MFKNLSPIEVCQKMSAICQKSADETSPGTERERLQAAANKFVDEANAPRFGDEVNARKFKDEANALAN